MRWGRALLLAAAFVAAGCGDDEPTSTAASPSTSEGPAPTTVWFVAVAWADDPNDLEARKSELDGRVAGPHPGVTVTLSPGACFDPLPEGIGGTLYVLAVEGADAAAVEAAARDAGVADPAPVEVAIRCH